jgi:hypothetical protein
MGATIVTLHQGIPGVMLNPYINWPFTPSDVANLTAYVSAANALGMAAKYYYTTRELSNHAVELFALKAMANGARCALASRGRLCTRKFVCCACKFVLVIFDLTWLGLDFRAQFVRACRTAVIAVVCPLS